MIGKDELAAMKKSAIIVNTSRGPVIDEKAMTAALSAGNLFGAGLDVFDEEPTPPDNPLLKLDNVILTAHLAGPTFESNITRLRNGFDNVQRVARGEPALWVVPELLETILGAALAAPFIAREGFAQGDWPKGPVRWVVAFAAGGAADTVARNIGVRVAEIIGQQVIIDNRTGGNAVVAANAVLQAPRDGQTFLAETRALLTHANRLESLGKRLGRGEEGGLCIGYIENAMHAGILPNALRVLRVSRPNVHVALYNQSSAEQLEGLRQRSLDIAL
eukprot:gene2477-3221_t